MLSFFRRPPTYADVEFAELSLMFTGDSQDPTYRRELLVGVRLDFSLQSLKHVDSYLGALHIDPPHNDSDTLRMVLRCGAYVGEVIRRNSPHEMHWVTFEEAARHSKFVRGLSFSVSTAGILWTDRQNMCFPLGKVCKFIENGCEDSVHSFASVLIESHNGR